MKLYDVSLEDFMFPCFAYCMKRTGLNLSWSEFRKLEEKPVPDTAQIPIGAILRWDADNGNNRWQQSFLTIKGQRVISTWNNTNVHYAVYEVDSIVSDLVVGDKDPYIRLRELDKLYQPPKGMVIYETDEVWQDTALEEVIALEEGRRRAEDNLNAALLRQQELNNRKREI